MELKDLIGGTIEKITAENCFIVSKHGKTYTVIFDGSDVISASIEEDP